MSLEKSLDKFVSVCAFPRFFSYSKKSGKNFSLQTTSSNNLSNSFASPKDVVIGWKESGRLEKSNQP